MKLYSYWRSSSSWRVRIALAWKQLAYDYVAVDLLGAGEQHSERHRALNPLAQVPVLELDDGRRLTQSMAIIEYLEEAHPSPPLLPRDAYQRARARSLAELVNSGVQPLQNLSVLKHVKRALGQDEQAWGRHFVERGLRALEAEAQSGAGRFLVGESPTIADVFLVPQMLGARRFGVDLALLPTLVRIERECVQLPAFIAAAPESQPDATSP
jgi:maleylpyruvate isomerase